MDVTLQLKTNDEIIRNHGIGKGDRVQKFIDSEVLRRSDKYTPKQTGEMIRSGTRGTVIGMGKVIYTAPYAKSQYQHNRGRGMQGTARGGLRGRLWFERMKADHKDAILQGAARIAGCKYEP